MHVSPYIQRHVLLDKETVRQISVMDPVNVPSPWYCESPTNKNVRNTPEERFIQRQNGLIRNNATKTNFVCPCLGVICILIFGFVLLVIPIYILGGMLEKENKLRLGNGKSQIYV